VAEDGDDPVPAPSGRRTRALIGIGAAAVVIVALGGYALVRPSSVGATATRLAAAPNSTAAADAAVPAAVSPGASTSRADPQQAPSTPRAPEAQPPVAVPEQPAAVGTIEVVSPVLLNVSEGGRPLGASGGPIQLSVGRHTLNIGREDLGYQAVQVVDVKPGRPHRIEPSLPSGVANLNATPWAEVWIDGRKVGETPLGRVQLTIGSHEVQFRHPELGDQTRTLVVTTGSVALLSVDMKK
jgi:serine/threonine-protein kinase